MNRTGDLVLHVAGEQPTATRKLARSALRASAEMPAGQEQFAELTPAEFETLRAARPTGLQRLSDYSLCSTWQELVFAAADEVQALDSGRDEYFRRHGIVVESGQPPVRVRRHPGAHDRGRRGQRSRPAPAAGDGDAGLRR